MGNLLATGTVPSGAAGSLVSGFRFVPITPVILGVGAYAIGSFDNGTSPDPFLFSVQSITPIAGLSFGPGALFTNANSLTRPTRPYRNLAFLRPNFVVGTPTAVPEPGALGITLLGLAIVMGAFYHFRRRALSKLSPALTLLSC